jgi:hypothetical protein
LAWIAETVAQSTGEVSNMPDINHACMLASSIMEAEMIGDESVRMFAKVEEVIKTITSLRSD